MNQETENSKNQLIAQYKQILINNKMINEDEPLALVSESQIKKHGGKIKDTAFPIYLECPPDAEHDTFYKEYFYPASFIENMEDFLPSYNSQKTSKNNDESIEQIQPNLQEEDEDIFSSDDISYQNVLIPHFAIMTDKGFKSYTDCIVEDYDSSKKEYTIRTSNDELLKIPKDTVDKLFKNEQVAQQEIEKEQKEEIAIATGVGIVFQDLANGIEGTKLPDFSLIDEQRSGGVLKTFSNFVVQGYNEDNESFVVSNGDTDLVLSKTELEEITTSEKLKNNPANSEKYEKLLQTQYDDYFKIRDNKSCNFVHNFQVYCRKEANSPLDSIRIAKEIISNMSHKEKKKTESLMKELKGKHQTITEALVEMYNVAVKVVPLNESYIEKNYPDKYIPHSYTNTIVTPGEKISNFQELKKINRIDPSKDVDRNLRIGDTLHNVNVPVNKTFGKGKDSVMFDELTVVASSEYKNTITFKNKDKSLIEVSRDDFLEMYKKTTQKEMKKEEKQEAKQHRNRKDYSIEMS